MLAGMQAVVYSTMGPPGGSAPVSTPPLVDFWWLKPRVDDAARLEDMTLHRHANGPHKNDPGASKKAYGPFASLVTGGRTADGKLLFGMTTPAAGEGTPRLFIDCATSGARYFVVWVWQEDWSPVVTFGKKYIKGKIVYQKGSGEQLDGAAGFFARPFAVDGKEGLLLPPGEHLEERVHGALPSTH